MDQHGLHKAASEAYALAVRSREIAVAISAVAKTRAENVAKIKREIGVIMAQMDALRKGLEDDDGEDA